MNNLPFVLQVPLVILGMLLAASIYVVVSIIWAFSWGGFRQELQRTFFTKARIFYQGFPFN